MPLPHGAGPTVLCIEDNASNLRLMERIFALRPNAHLITATVGADGLELARLHEPALILLDLDLPDQSGYDVLRALRADPAFARTPVIIASADTTASQMARARAEGAADYFTKPLDINVLLASIDGYLASGGENAG